MRKRSLIRRLRMNSYISTIPTILFFFIMLFSLLNNTLSYDKIVRNITKANNYSRNFREQIDETMYLTVAYGCSVEELKQKEPYGGITEPYLLIKEMRTVFSNLRDISNEGNRRRISVIEQDLDNLEDVCHKVEERAQSSGNYDENMRLLDLNVYILTDLIQEQVQEYIFYEAQSMETLRRTLYDRTIALTILFVIVFALYMLFSTWYSHKLFTDIRETIDELKTAAEAVGRGDFSCKVPESDDEEFAILAKSFNHMSEEIRNLIKTTKKEQQNLRASELRLYQAQINPHFLYNTLDTIVALVESGMGNDAVRMISYLSDFFRTTLSSGRDYISVQEEENHVESYLEIQQMRYEDILSYTIDFSDEIKNFQILKLTLQPLVENALYHGIKEKRGKGTITVTGRMEGNDLAFVIRDNGIGMDEKTLQALEESIKTHQKGKTGFGIYNVEQRILLTYGQAYGITFESELGKGTVATVRIPAIPCEVRLSERP